MQSGKLQIARLPGLTCPANGAGFPSLGRPDSFNQVLLNRVVAVLREEGWMHMPVLNAMPLPT